MVVPLAFSAIAGSLPIENSGYKVNFSERAWRHGLKRRLTLACLKTNYDANSFVFAPSEIATTAGWRSLRSAEMA